MSGRDQPSVGPGSPWAPPGYGAPPTPYGPPRPGHGPPPPPGWGHAPPGWGPPPPGWGQPYGPPGWAPPPRPRRPFPWKVLGLVVGILALIAVVVVLLLAFVIGPRFARIDVLDADAVAQGVTRVVTEDWRRQITGVTCPADQEVSPGVRFTCQATVDGRPAQVPVTIVGADGTYSVGQPR